MRKIVRGFLFLVLLVIIVLLYGRYGWIAKIDTKEYKIESANIDSSFDGLKIVHFSDLHYLRVVDSDFLKRVVDEIILIDPDIVVFTGDIIDKDFKINEEKEDKLIELLKKIPTKYGKYAIIGNHDHVGDAEMISHIYDSSGFILLKNSYDIIYGENDDKLFIGGTDTYSYDMADIDEVMKDLSEDNQINYKIILTHEPDYADEIVSKYDVDLILAGHSHNGQINIPFAKELFLPYGARKYYDNLYEIGNTKLYVSSGLGVSRLNFRLFDNPSINFYRINKITD